MFMVSEHVPREAPRRGAHHEHLEQFNQQTRRERQPASLGLTKPYRKLVAIRSPQNLFMLEKALAETDPETTGDRRDDGQGDAAPAASWPPGRPTSTPTTSS